MEGNFKACVCTNPSGKPVMYNENSEEPEVSVSKNSKSLKKSVVVFFSTTMS